MEIPRTFAPQRNLSFIVVVQEQRNPGLELQYHGFTTERNNLSVAPYEPAMYGEAVCPFSS
jgi:hypothetical protein